MEEKKINVLITVNFAEPLLEKVRELSPRLEVTLAPARRPEEIEYEVWKDTEVLYTDTVLPQPEKVPALRWVQFHYSGLDFALESALMKERKIMATSLSGAAAPQMAEYILMMLLALARDMPGLIDHQSRGQWPRDRIERFTRPTFSGSTVGIVGYGSVGRELARLLVPFGVTILAARRNAMSTTDKGYTIPGRGDPLGELFTRLYPYQALPSMLKECDFIVVCLPLTQETRALFNEQLFKAIKPGAHLVHVGRGGVMDSQALQAALQDKNLASAALDVFPEEPLPADSPLWKQPNLLLTPHVAGLSQFYKERAISLFTCNLERYLQQEPLLNLFDFEKQY